MTTLVYEFDPEEFAIDDDASTSPFCGLKKCNFQADNDYYSPIRLKYEMWEVEQCEKSVRVINTFNEFKRQKTEEVEDNFENQYYFDNQIHSNSIISKDQISNSIDEAIETVYDIQKSSMTESKTHNLKLGEIANNMSPSLKSSQKTSILSNLKSKQIWVEQRNKRKKRK